MAETGQTYTYADDNPPNGSDPSGNFTVYSGTLTVAQARWLGTFLAVGSAAPTAVVPEGLGEVVTALLAVSGLDGAPLFVAANEAEVEANNYNRQIQRHPGWGQRQRVGLVRFTISWWPFLGFSLNAAPGTKWC